MWRDQKGVLGQRLGHVITFPAGLPTDFLKMEPFSPALRQELMYSRLGLDSLFDSQSGLEVLGGRAASSKLLPFPGFPNLEVGSGTA